MTTYAQSIPGRQEQRRPTCAERRAVQGVMTDGIVAAVCLVAGLGLGVTHGDDAGLLWISVGLLLVGLWFAGAMERARRRMRGGQRNA